MTMENTKTMELNEQELENVNGGIALTTAIGAVACMALGGAEISFITSYAVKKYKNWKKSR